MLEYIPGDFVIIETESAKPRVVKVSTVDEDSVIYCEGWGEVRFYDKIKPIPLTPEILEKNGWHKGTCEFVHYRKKFGSLVLRLTGLKYGWIIRCGNMCLIKRVKFIHQLQHFLFGLGLNSEMEV